MDTRLGKISSAFLLCFIALLAAACTTTATTAAPTVPAFTSEQLTATAQNIGDRQTAIAATSTAIQLTIEAGQWTPTASPVVAEASETPLPASPTPITTEAPTALPSATVPPATAVATTAPAATSTAGAAGDPVINSFTVDKARLNPGEVLTFNWATTNATKVEISHILSNNMFGGMGRGPLNASGSASIITDNNAVNTNKFLLIATNDAGVTVSQTLEVTFNCKLEWFFAPAPPYCPSTASQTKNVVEQAFQNGLMLWIPTSVGDGYISILYNDGRMYTIADFWTNAEAESDPSIMPPEGLYQPVRGFGKVWRELQGTRERLGWALSPETQFSTPYQHEGGSMDPKGWNTYLRVSDGRVVHIIGHYADVEWEYVTE